MEKRKKQMAMTAKIAGRRTLRSIQRKEGKCTVILLQQEIAKNNNNYVIFCIKKEKTFYVY